MPAGLVAAAEPAAEPEALPAALLPVVPAAPVLEPEPEPEPALSDPVVPELADLSRTCLLAASQHLVAPDEAGAPGLDCAAAMPVPMSIAAAESMVSFANLIVLPPVCVNGGADAAAAPMHGHRRSSGAGRRFY
jgi:hypothetical protein